MKKKEPNKQTNKNRVKIQANKIPTKKKKEEESEEEG